MKSAVFSLLILALFPLNMMHRYGARWEFSRYGTPRAALGAPGMYRDGTPVDPLTASLLRTGCEEEVMLGFCVAIAAFGIAAAYFSLDTARKHRLLMRERCRFLRRLERVE